jgi:hypothetical protein
MGFLCKRKLLKKYTILPSKTKLPAKLGLQTIYRIFQKTGKSHFSLELVISNLYKEMHPHYNLYIQIRAPSLEL